MALDVFIIAMMFFATLAIIWGQVFQNRQYVKPGYQEALVLENGLTGATRVVIEPGVIFPWITWKVLARLPINRQPFTLAHAVYTSDGVRIAVEYYFDQLLGRDFHQHTPVDPSSPQHIRPELIEKLCVELPLSDHTKVVQNVIRSVVAIELGQFRHEELISAAGVSKSVHRLSDSIQAKTNEVFSGTGFCIINFRFTAAPGFESAAAQREHETRSRHQQYASSLSDSELSSFATDQFGLATIASRLAAISGDQSR